MSRRGGEAGEISDPRSCIALYAKVRTSILFKMAQKNLRRCSKENCQDLTYWILSREKFILGQVTFIKGQKREDQLRTKNGKKKLLFCLVCTGTVE